MEIFKIFTEKIHFYDKITQIDSAHNSWYRHGRWIDAFRNYEKSINSDELLGGRNNLRLFTKIVFEKDSRNFDPFPKELKNHWFFKRLIFSYKIFETLKFYTFYWKFKLF